MIGYTNKVVISSTKKASEGSGTTTPKGPPRQGTGTLSIFVQRAVQQLPAERFIVIPFFNLGKLAPHREHFLAGVSKQNPKNRR